MIDVRELFKNIGLFFIWVFSSVAFIMFAILLVIEITKEVAK